VSLSLDANIFVYAVDADDPSRQSEARAIIGAASKVDAVITEQVMLEFLNAAQKKAKAKPSAAIAMVRSWSGTFKMQSPSAETLGTTLDLMTRHRLSVWDSRLLAVCAEGGVTTLLSEDLSDGASYGTVAIVNPFNPKNREILVRLLPL